MCLRFMFSLTTRLAAWLRLARREEKWKTAEILLRRHQGCPRMEQRGYRLSEVDAFDVCCGSDVWEAKHAE